MKYYKTRLITEPLQDGKSWRLEHNFVVFIPELGDRVIPIAFMTDFASIPRLFRTLIASPATGKHRYAAVVHDYLYKKQEITRSQSDSTFLTLMLNDGVNRFLAYNMYYAVKVFGWIQWNRKKDF